MMDKLFYSLLKYVVCSSIQQKGTDDLSPPQMLTCSRLLNRSHPFMLYMTSWHMKGQDMLSSRLMLSDCFMQRSAI